MPEKIHVLFNALKFKKSESVVLWRAKKSEIRVQSELSHPCSPLSWHAIENSLILGNKELGIYLDWAVEMPWEAVFNEQGSEREHTVHRLPQPGVLGLVTWQAPGMIRWHRTSFLQDAIESVQDVYPVI